ncbi:MAG TPA: DUF721 domain-containing protein [bacterium]|nr:DUF721 domain-containing protein [bacterium]HPN29678.1 DUF721 domain-containing protein [bacterium]
MKTLTKPLSRYCIFFNEKIYDVKKCYLCDKYENKNEEPESEAESIDNFGSPNMKGHIKFNSCNFSQSLNCDEIAGKPVESFSSLKKVSFITKKYINNLTGNSHVAKTIILKNWHDIAGKIFQDSVIPEKLSKGVLILKSSSPAVTQSFLFVKSEIIKKINSALNQNLVKKIKVVQ